MIRQYVLTIHEDYSVRLTERAVAKRDSRGRFAAKQNRRSVKLGTATCPKCGARLAIMKEVA